ncbi:MAG: HAD superfamily hydrolase (TIGR01509 family) [Limisphaerales bacterium]|jgi:HAD superfamily hydrolase (TIGR01509 family)
MPDIRVITLDLDNTLWDVDSVIIRAEANMKRWLADQAPEVFAAYQPELLSNLRQQALSEVADKRHDLSFMRIHILTKVGEYAGHTTSAAHTIAQGAFEVFFEGRNQVQFFPGALEMLTEVGQHFPIVALTNGNANVDQAGIGSYLSGAYSSADVGASKPDEAMFNAPLRDLGFKPDQAIHIGDHLVDDVHGANEAGLFSIWINFNNRSRSDHEPQPSLEVSQLQDVHPAIQAINHGD